MSWEAWGTPREDGPTCRGCGEFLTTDELQAGGHTCRVSSNDLEPLQISEARAGRIGDGWEVTPDGFGFVRFDDPLEARAVLAAARRVRSAARPVSGDEPQGHNANQE
jgi:hypothetical protein